MCTTDDPIALLAYLIGVVHGAEASGFASHVTATVGQTLAGQDTVLERAANASVLTVEVADFATADTDVTGGHVDVRSDVSVEFAHEALAKAEHFGVGLALWIEIGATFAT